MQKILMSTAVYSLIVFAPLTVSAQAQDYDLVILNARIAVLVNDFGSINIDAELITGVFTHNSKDQQEIKP